MKKFPEITKKTDVCGCVGGGGGGGSGGCSGGGGCVAKTPCNVVLISKLFLNQHRSTAALQKNLLNYIEYSDREPSRKSLRTLKHNHLATETLDCLKNYKTI